jgi:hypothetical protein
MCTPASAARKQISTLQAWSMPAAYGFTAIQCITLVQYSLPFKLWPRSGVCPLTCVCALDFWYVEEAS